MKAIREPVGGGGHARRQTGVRHQSAARGPVGFLQRGGRGDGDRRRILETTKIRLPNGSSSVHEVCVSPDGTYAYVAHILSRYQMPTTQLERGWMNTNAMSVIDVAAKKLLNTVLLDDIDLGAAMPWAWRRRPTASRSSSATRHARDERDRRRRPDRQAERHAQDDRRGEGRRPLRHPRQLLVRDRRGRAERLGVPGRFAAASPVAAGRPVGTGQGRRPAGSTARAAWT